LGLHFYEALAFGQPIITNDNPPMNELVEDGFNGILVRGHQDGVANSGIPAFVPDVDELADAMERLGDPGVRAHQSEGAREMAARRSWQQTLGDVGRLVDSLG
jgi:glycosyltransferase involved in cell wall biosynthesis